MTENDPSFSDYALAEVHVDPKVAAAFAAWLTELAGRAVFVSPRGDVPEWVGTAAELLYAWAEEIPWANGQARNRRAAGPSKSPRAGGLHGGFLEEVLAERLVPAVAPSPPGSPLTMRSLLEQQRAARLAVGMADALAAAVRAGDAERIARCLVAFEQASSTYYAPAWRAYYTPGRDQSASMSGKPNITTNAGSWWNAITRETPVAVGAKRPP